MRRVAFRLGALGLLAAQATEANAAACAAGPRGAACTGPRGTVAHARSYRDAVVRPAGCYWRAGVRVCR
jgi:hypothetical protein